MMWALAGLGGLAVSALSGGLALRYAISRNGPAVLSAVDRLTAGSRGTERKAAIALGAHKQQKLIVWGPDRRDPADAPLPVIVFAHGGSWRSGDPIDYGFIARAFVPEGFIVVLVGYRLGEAGAYPAMLEDTARALAWTHGEIAAYGGDPQRIMIAGHSAGAYIAVMVALEEQWLGREGLSPDIVNGVVGLSGPYDFVPLTSDSTLAAFGHVVDPEITQPNRHIRTDAPQMLLIHGEKDSLVKPRNTRFLVQALESRGAQVTAAFYSEMEHNDPLIALAAPWRTRRDVAELIARFARAASAKRNEPVIETRETSVPVQGESR
ncbi:alpha/beta hydrolase [Qipengyuania sp. ASV99]|uniref:alpha/beta hydrolase n=1 Tax=Qipengyuania sp. ASV99 TaxID=3399681 RepID=UPI003A4C627D